MSGRIKVVCADPGHPKARTAKLETFTRTDDGWIIERPGEPRWVAKPPRSRSLRLAGDEPLPAVSIEYDSVMAYSEARPQAKEQLQSLAEADRAATARHRVEMLCPLCPHTVGPVVVKRERLWELLDYFDGLGVSQLDLEQLRRILSGSK